jgi:Rps23 Pro-64 3,4-dihydroxylase Tpa1-like proline 4-hydroxylase
VVKKVEHVSCGDERLGIWRFPNAIIDASATVNAIERIAGGQDTGECLWSPAQVGHYKLSTSYRKCFDWKPNLTSLSQEKYDIEDIRTVNSMRNTIIDTALEYAQNFNVDLGFIETMNIIKYYDGNHFGYHSDDGFSYVASVSSVVYLNSDFTGGALHFKHLDITIQPEVGDIIVFPANFMYMHSALNVESGIKYSVVTMFDYNRHEYFKTTYRALHNSSIEKFDI